MLREAISHLPTFARHLQALSGSNTRCFIVGLGMSFRFIMAKDDSYCQAKCFNDILEPPKRRRRKEETPLSPLSRGIDEQATEHCWA